MTSEHWINFVCISKICYMNFHIVVCFVYFKRNILWLYNRYNTNLQKMCHTLKRAAICLYSCFIASCCRLKCIIVCSECQLYLYRVIWTSNFKEHSYLWKCFILIHSNEGYETWTPLCPVNFLYWNFLCPFTSSMAWAVSLFSVSCVSLIRIYFI